MGSGSAFSRCCRRRLVGDVLSGATAGWLRASSAADGTFTEAIREIGRHMTRLLRYARGLLRECAHCAVEQYGQWEGSFTSHPAHRCCVEAGEGGRDQSIWPGILRLVRTGPESHWLVACRPARAETSPSARGRRRPPRACRSRCFLISPSVGTLIRQRESACSAKVSLDGGYVPTLRRAPSHLGRSLSVKSRSTAR